MSLHSKKDFLLLTFSAILFISGCDNIFPKGNKPVVSKTPTVVTEPVAVTAAVSAPVSASDSLATANEQLPKDVLVKVGDWTLTVADFDERVKNIKKVVPTFDEKKADSKYMLIDELIRQQLMVSEAREQKLNESTEVRAAIKDFENNILVQELVAGLTKNISATETEAREYYDKNPDVFVNPVEKKVSEIVVPTEAEAKEILILLLQGADFTQTAKDRSKAKSAANGGDLGFLSRPDVKQEYQVVAVLKTVDALTNGGVSSIFQGPEGYYIVKVMEVRGGDKVTFDSVKAELVKGLTSQKQQKVVLEKMAEVAKKVKVNKNKELLNVKIGE